MKFYIVDTTSTKNKQTPVILFDTREGVIKHLEEMCKKQFKMTRKQYMDNCQDLGIQEDNIGRSFYTMMTEYFQIGVIRKDKPVRCDIFDATLYKKGEQGD